MRESRVWQYISSHAPEWLAIERLEVVQPLGVADCFWTDKRSGQSGWLELKFCEENHPEFEAGRIPKIRPEQPMFLRRQASNNVPAGMVLRVRHADDPNDSTWYLWRATPERSWTTMMRSTDAIRYATKVWNDRSPSVEEMIAALLPL